MERDSVSERASVGRALQKNVTFSVAHPLYRALVDSMEKKVSELSAARGAMRATTSASLVTISLPSEDLAELSRLFPEFRLVNYGTYRPAHAVYVQLRRLACEWLVLQARKLAEDVVICGCPLLACLRAGFSKVTLLVDLVNPMAVHERHMASMDAYRVYSNTVAVSNDLAETLERGPYDDFLQGKGVSFQFSESARVRGQVVCVDGCLYPYSPMQVAATMLVSEAQVALGFFPYHPCMLVNDEGELPGFGVNFLMTADEVRFTYAEGLAGVVAYGKQAWQSWLTSHTFCVGVDAQQWFQLELLKHRGCVMFYRLVRLPCAPVQTELCHALDLGSDVPQYLFTSWRLKSLGRDPTKRDSWACARYLVAQRLVDRVYQFAMQLPREQFTRYAIRKQLHVVNDRVTIEGTSVKVNSPLGEKMLDALVVDIFSRAFVDRYEAGTLSEEARKFTETLAAFSTAPTLSRVWMVVSICAISLWEATLSPVNQIVRAAADAVRRFWAGGPVVGRPTVEVAPSFALVGEAGHFVDLEGGSVAAAELTRRAALSSVGFLSEVVRTMAQLQMPLVSASKTTFRVDSFGLFDTKPAVGKDVDDVVAMMRTLNPVDESPVVRRMIEQVSVRRALSHQRQMSFNPVADPVYIFNDLHSQAFSGVAEQNLEYDTASISLDPQDRTLAAPYLRLPRYFGDAPKPKLLYHSRVRALNVPKRQQTLQELLSAISARNLNAPQVALPQDDAAMARTVWGNFLDMACVPDARDRLKRFQRDRVGLEEDAFREWVTQSTPDKFKAVRRELEEQSKALAEMTVSDYLVMLKADVKPSLSAKPLQARTEPQVIVYHEKALSSLYSSIFRVLVRRFLSLLKPNYHVNLTKDIRDVEAFIRGVHPFEAAGLKYLENDFSKYDKSQGKFAFVLEELMFTELGMNLEFLGLWLGGHVECNLRAVAMGLSLHVLYQRKSGDATTAFGNVLLNIVSVCYAYRGTQVVWAVFMGDDSLVCASSVAHEADAVAILAEVFNLGAKTYLTDSPYFASSFIAIDEVNMDVYVIPDPIKRIERWSMMVSGEDPQWHERFVSSRDALQVYLNCAKTTILPRMIHERYNVPAAAATGVADAVATVLSDERMFRKMWEETPRISNY